MSLGTVRLAVSLILACTAAAYASPPSLPDSPAGEILKRVPREVLNASKPKRFSLEERKAQEETAKRRDADDTIVVLGERDPEDAVRAKKAPILALRETLERERRATPAEITQAVLCLVGLCGRYSVDGVPPEPSRDARQAAYMNRSFSDLGRQFYGSLQ